MNLNILVISFYFPPFKRVGGRRWAKHCKYLQRKGINFWVLATDFPGISPWDKDIVAFSDRISRIKAGTTSLPYHLRKLPRNLFEKIIWKFSLWTWPLKRKTINENFRDVSLGNEELFLTEARQMIRRNKHNTVILSVGPFSYATILPQLKSEFPDLKFVIDYRDYWEDEFPGLSEREIRREKEKQVEVLKSVDLVFSPNEEMRTYYEEYFQKRSFCLPHGYDQEDVIKFGQANKNTNEYLTIVYGGAFYPDIHKEIELIKQLLDALEKKIGTQAKFYVSIRGYEQELKHPLIKRFDSIESGEYFNVVNESDYVILILPENRVNAMSSKFFELVAMRKPILYFGGEGEVSRFLQARKLGWHISPARINEQVEEVLSNLKTRIVPDQAYDVTKHSFTLVAEGLIQQLNAIF